MDPQLPTEALLVDLLRECAGYSSFRLLQAAYSMQETLWRSWLDADGSYAFRDLRVPIQHDLLSMHCYHRQWKH